MTKLDDILGKCDAYDRDKAANNIGARSLGYNHAYHYRGKKVSQSQVEASYGEGTFERYTQGWNEGDEDKKKSKK
jgi:hypothetical protein